MLVVLRQCCVELASTGPKYGQKFQRQMATTTGPHAAKKELRSQVKQLLASLDAGSVAAQSRKAQETLLSLPQYKQAKSLSVYLSMPNGEASTDLIVQDALKAGKTVYVPHMHKIATPTGQSKLMDMLRLSSLDEYTGLARDNWGIPTLPQAGLDARDNAMGGRGLMPGGSSESRLDLIVMPAVAFDRGMRRLGHGAGYYDSFLWRYTAESARRKPLLVGLCLAEQVLEDGAVPVTELDWNVDIVVDGRQNVLQRVIAPE